MTKNLERKKNEQIQGRTNRRKPICNPTLQLVVVNRYTKYEVSILNSCGVIFDEKVLRITEGQTEGRTEGRTEPQTDVNQYTPTFSKRGYNNDHYQTMLLNNNWRKDFQDDN